MIKRQVLKANSVLCLPNITTEKSVMYISNVKLFQYAFYNKKI